MTDRHRLTDVETVREAGSWAFTVRTPDGVDEEVVLVPCEEGVRAWGNRCTHETRRLHREDAGAVVRDGAVVCPRHGSMFDVCSGDCDNGPAAGTTLPAVDVTVEDGQVYLTDDADYLHEGVRSSDWDGGGPSSTSHLGL